MQIPTTSYSDRRQDTLDEEEQEEASLTKKFFFGNPIDCAKYLLGQRWFAKDLVQAPMKEWNSEEPPQ